MKKVYKYIILAAIAVGVMFALSSGVSNDAAYAAPTPDPSISDTTLLKEDPDILEQFGPPGVIISTVLTGALLIIRSLNEGRKIDVTTYKERATDAETRSNEEIGKVHTKLAQLEKKLDDVIKSRDEYRDTLEDRKAQFTQQILDMEQRHQRELEDLHTALMVEIHVRHQLERVLVQNGISVPDTPPPYTKGMKDAVTVEDRVQADTTTATMGIIREHQEGS